MQGRNLVRVISGQRTSHLALRSHGTSVEAINSMNWPQLPLTTKNNRVTCDRELLFEFGHKLREWMDELKGWRHRGWGLNAGGGLQKRLLTRFNHYRQ